MPREGFKNLTIKAELHKKIKDLAEEKGVKIQDIVEQVLQAEVPPE